MQDVSDSRRDSFVHPTYAEPLSGLRISWGSLLAGTVTILSVSWLLWALGFAIVMLCTNGNVGSIKGSLLALWIIAMATTLVGAFAGGWVAGVLPGNPRKRIGAVHAFIAWGLAFLLSSGVGWFALGATARTAAMATTQTAAAAVQATGAAAGGAAGANVPLATRAVQTLESLGYSPAQARAMVGKAQAGVQGSGPAQVSQAVGGVFGAAASGVIGVLIALGWSWWGVWFTAAFLAMAGGALGASRLLGPARRGESEQARVVERPMRPLTPAPTL